KTFENQGACKSFVFSQMSTSLEAPQGFAVVGGPSTPFQQSELTFAGDHAKTFVAQVFFQVFSATRAEPPLAIEDVIGVAKSQLGSAQAAAPGAMRTLELAGCHSCFIGNVLAHASQVCQAVSM